MTNPSCELCDGTLVMVCLECDGAGEIISACEHDGEECDLCGGDRVIDCLDCVDEDEFIEYTRTVVEEYE